MWRIPPTLNGITRSPLPRFTVLDEDDFKSLYQFFFVWGTKALRDNLRRWKTGGLRRDSSERPFTDIVPSERTPQEERKIVNHPSLKPQRFMRYIVRAALPLGEGRVLDPFMGGGSTIAAAEYVGYASAGVELEMSLLFFDMMGIFTPVASAKPEYCVATSP